MKNPFRTIVFSLLFCLAASYGFAQKFSLLEDSLQEKGFILESSLGIGYVNGHATQPSISFHTGYDNYILTARFLRSNGGTSFIFENSWLAGYRFNFKKGFSSTLSAGAGDIAFVKRYGQDNQRILNETVGLTIDAQVQWNVYDDGRPCGFGLFANYYTTFNAFNNLNGFMVGLSVSPVNIRKMAKYERRDPGRLKAAEESSTAKQRREHEKSVKRTARLERNNNHHWEMYGFAGTAKRPFNGGFGMLFEKNKIILGANFTWESQALWQEPYHNPHYPPYIVSYHHFKDKQTEKAIFAGYRVWETDHIGLTVAAGPVWKKNVTLIGNEQSYRMWYLTIYEAKTATGITLQSELSYTFRNRAFGFGLIPFINIYKAYVSPGAVMSLRFGFLR